MHLAQGAGGYHEILAERRHRTAIDIAGSADHGVAGQILVRHAEMLAAVADMPAYFLKGIRLEQGDQALARRQQPLGVTLLDLVFTAGDQ